MAKKFIGRKAEQEVLQTALQSDEAEMISVIGRRRVGKTYLIRTVYGKQIDFELSGIQDATSSEQLRNFAAQIEAYFPNTLVSQPPKDWLDAFILLIRCLKKKEKEEKLIVFLDEVPWLATHKSGFLKGLSYFWNSWAVKEEIVVILCGSAASWMIQKILRHKGGLHNRVTRRIRLKAFNLAETNEYLESRDVFFDHYQLLQLYMVTGGIPHYLKEARGGRSATQNINRICFSKDGLLRDEFVSLYPALFDRSDYHVTIIRALAEKHNGMTRGEIVKATKLPEGGRVSRVLEELSESGFITAYPAYGKRRHHKLWRLTDEYSLFYLKFIENNILGSDNVWEATSQTQPYRIWCGYAFENICLKHVPQIKKALGISGVSTTTASFYQKGTAQQSGTQIDLLIERNDHIINLFETKFHNVAFTVSKEYALKLREKIRVFQEATHTNKQIQLAMITTFGVKHNKHSLGLVQNTFDMDIFFD